jgi:hypothetical protein
MKKTIISLILVVATTAAFAQQKKLPEKVTITLTQQQILKIDSCVRVASSNMDSKRQTEWFISGFTPIYEQVNKQLIIDSVKVKGK